MKLITLNIDCHKDWKEKKEILITNLKKESPDILCLQELSSKQEGSSTLFTNEATEIVRELDYDGYFSASYKCSANQGIFIKKGKIEPIEGYHFSFSGILSDGVTDKHRRFLLAQLLKNRDGKEFLVINLHLSVNKRFRYKSWSEIKLWLNKNNLFNKNIFIVGDFNTYEDEDVDKKIVESGFTNAWKEINDEPCVTYRSSSWWLDNYPNDIHSQAIERRKKSWPESPLDYIFYRGNIVVKSMGYLDLVPTVTDHKGLVLEFEINDL